MSFLNLRRAKKPTPKLAAMSIQIDATDTCWGTGVVVPGTTVIVLGEMLAGVSNSHANGPTGPTVSVPSSQVALISVLNVGVKKAATLVQLAKSNVVLPPVASPHTIVTLNDRKSEVAVSRLPPSGITLSSHMKVPLPVWPLFPVNVNEGTDKLT